MNELSWHCKAIRAEMKRGLVVPFLGAGVGMVGRPQGATWQEGFTPTGAELAAHLAEVFGIPNEPGLSDLARAAEFVTLMADEDRLIRTLCETFPTPTRPTEIHRFLAAEARAQLDAGQPNPWPVVLTTNYDDALEVAFVEASVPFDIVVYHDLGHGPQRARFYQKRADGHAGYIEDTTRPTGLGAEGRTIILKIHGALNYASPDEDSVVITEAQYASFLADNVVDNLPFELGVPLVHSRFLFLGYSLSDWNMRVLLLRLRAEQRRVHRSWAIQPQATEFSRLFFRAREITLLECLMETWIEEMKVAER